MYQTLQDFGSDVIGEEIIHIVTGRNAK